MERETTRRPESNDAVLEEALLFIRANFSRDLGLMRLQNIQAFLEGHLSYASKKNWGTVHTRRYKGYDLNKQSTS